MNELPGLAGDRLKRAISAFIRELFPSLDYYRPHLYVVALWSFSGQTGDLIPHASTKGMPTLSGVPIRSTVNIDVPTGLEVVVQFDNGDPTRPFISHVGAGITGNQLNEIDISRDDDIIPVPSPTLTARRVVRYGDPIMFSAPGPGTVVAPTISGSFSRVKA